MFSQEETRENVTISELSFVPTTEDDGKSITCRAENPNVTGLFLETSWKIDVVCKYTEFIQSFFKIELFATLQFVPIFRRFRENNYQNFSNVSVDSIATY